MDLKTFASYKKIFGEQTDFWLRFLTEKTKNTTEELEELMENLMSPRSLKEVEESAYTEQEIDAYEDFWDKLGAERLLLVDSNNISLEKGLALGREEGRAEGLAQGRADSLAEVARAMLAKGMDAATIFELTGLKDTDIASL